MSNQFDNEKFHPKASVTTDSLRADDQFNANLASEPNPPSWSGTSDLDPSGFTGPGFTGPTDSKTHTEHERKEALRAKDARVHPKLKRPFDKSELKEHLSVQTVEDLKCFYIWIHEQQPGLVKRFNRVRHNIE